MFVQQLAQAAATAVSTLYAQHIEPSAFTINKTRKEFTGDYTLVVFPVVKISKKSPDATANDIGQELIRLLPVIESYNIVKGFLNLSLKQSFWLDFAATHWHDSFYGTKPILSSDNPYLIEFSSPNTNKPLHLGHIRNNLLGASLANIQKANGHHVVRVNLVNDRGIHICKSMLAWQKWGGGETPESAGLKGDHLVGKYYVAFDKQYKAEIASLIENGQEREVAEKQAPAIKEAQLMLVAWENADEHVRELWSKMNNWVYDGFAITYKNLGIEFEKTYYESNTYLLGKEIIQEGLQKGVFTQRTDGSVWVDLTADGLDEKLVLRADGTSVYITQDLGTAQLRYAEFHPQKMTYVVGNEQIYHFDVLKLILKKLEKPFADGIFHLSYGMVELPQGKMKSREGTVVDADDLIDEMIATAKSTTEELGKIEEFDTEEAQQLYRMIGLAALKYYILKVDPKKTMLFNPQESIDFNGNTGPFIQYTHARIRSVVRKAGEWKWDDARQISLNSHEQNLLRNLYEYPATVEQAGIENSPALIANYVFELAREYNQFYHEVSILRETDDDLRNFRIALSSFTGNVLKQGMGLLGIEVPERM